MCPTPGSDSSASKESGTSPLYFLTRIFESSNKDLDFCGDSPQGLMILRIYFLPSLIIFLGLLAFLNNSGATKLTLTSVHWAERITAISRVKTES